MDLSAHMRRLEGKSAELRLDLLERLAFGELVSYLTDFACAHPERKAEELFSGVLNLRLGRELVKLLGFSGTFRGMGPREIKRAAGLAKGLILPIEGTLGWEQAQVTAGGVPLSEVDMSTMESRPNNGRGRALVRSEYENHGIPQAAGAVSGGGAFKPAWRLRRV